MLFTDSHYQELAMQSNKTDSADVSTIDKRKQCLVCFKFFASSSSLYVHRRVHTKEKPYACHLCGNTFTQKSSLNTHMVLHSGQKNYSCIFCAKRFALKIYKTSHEKSCKSRENGSSQIVGNVVDDKKRRAIDTSQSDLTMHNLTADKYNGKYVLNSNNYHTYLAVPSSISHPTTQTFTGFKTEPANSGNNQIRAVQKPFRSVNSNPKPFQCHLCGQSYSQKSSLKTHLILHSGVKNFQCNFCSKKFALKLYKTTHERTCKERNRTTAMPVPVPEQTFDIQEIVQLISSTEPPTMNHL